MTFTPLGGKAQILLIKSLSGPVTVLSSKTDVHKTWTDSRRGLQAWTTPASKAPKLKITLGPQKRDTGQARGSCRPPAQLHRQWKPELQSWTITRPYITGYCLSLRANHLHSRPAQFLFPWMPKLTLGAQKQVGFRVHWLFLFFKTNKPTNLWSRTQDTLFLISAPLHRCKNVIQEIYPPKRERERDPPAYCFLTCDHVTPKDYFTKNMIRSRIAKWLSDKESACQSRCGFNPWVRKIPWRREWQPAPVLLPGKFHGQRSLVGYSPWGGKEFDTTEQLSNKMMSSPSVHLRP